MPRQWNPNELSDIAQTQVIGLSSRRADGSYSPWWPIWVVVIEDRVFVRSTDGPHKLWFSNARSRQVGKLQTSSGVMVHLRDEGGKR